MFSESESIKLLKQQVGEVPELVLVLGSGWKRVLDRIEVDKEIDFSKWLGVEASVPGHEGKLVVGTFKSTNNQAPNIKYASDTASQSLDSKFENQSGRLHTPADSLPPMPTGRQVSRGELVGGKRVGVMAGRVHMYEGYSAEEATMWVRVLHELGMKQMVLTAACGALNEKYQVGDFVLTSDLLTLFLALDNPLKGPNFIDMSQVFDEQMRDVARKTMVEMELPMKEGVYVYYHGPNFETPADKMALKFLGGDVVGMSTVPEMIMARALGVKVMSLAFVTNLAFVKHDHKDVLAAAKKSSKQMAELMEKIVLSI